MRLQHKEVGEGTGGEGFGSNTLGHPLENSGCSRLGALQSTSAMGQALVIIIFTSPARGTRGLRTSNMHGSPSKHRYPKPLELDSTRGSAKVFSQLGLSQNGGPVSCWLVPTGSRKEGNPKAMFGYFEKPTSSGCTSKRVSPSILKSL